MRAFLFSLIVLVLLLPVTHAEVTVCEKRCDFSSIQDAIDFANEGDTIVAEGFFFENLNITKHIILTGNATLYPSGSKAGISISADNVEVNGMSIKGGITGIEVVNSEGVKIENCNFNRNFYGVLLLGSSKCTIKGNNFENINESAIKLEGSDSNTISSNHIDGSKVAVHLFQSSENNLTDSSFVNVEAGVYLEGSLDNSITGNEISAIDTAIFMCHSGGNKVSENSADGDVFVHLLFSSKNTIEQNEAEGIYANFNSYKNDFTIKNLKLTGEEFQFSLTESILPEEFIPLSNVINVTVIPDLITETGYVELNIGKEEIDKLSNEINISTLAFYRLNKSDMERVSDYYNASSMLRFTSNKSGMYVLAVEKVYPKKPTTLSTPAPFPIKIPGFQVFYAFLAVTMAFLILKRR
ncbi:hypothetical protein DRP05_09835 [Archaeoglobales archaeon]|nr:MAG: hypothetical protein DRP05_09835 [Archaeoglobales archaeon]